VETSAASLKCSCILICFCSVELQVASSILASSSKNLIIITIISFLFGGIGDSFAEYIGVL